MEMPEMASVVVAEREATEGARRAGAVAPVSERAPMAPVRAPERRHTGKPTSTHVETPWGSPDAA